MKSLKKKKKNPQHQKIPDCLIYQLFTEVAAASSMDWFAVEPQALGSHFRLCLVLHVFLLVFNIFIPSRTHPSLRPALSPHSRVGSPSSEVGRWGVGSLFSVDFSLL